MTVSRDAFRRRRNYALALAAESVAPLLRAAARARSSGVSTDPTSWRRGLILGHSHVGDVLYRTCSLEQLKSGLPECRWDYLTSPSAAAVLNDNPALNSVLPVTFRDSSPLVGLDTFRRLRRTKYDAVLCTNTIRHLADFAFATALGTSNRVGYGDKGYSGLLTLPVPMAYPQPFPAYFRTLVGTLTGAAPNWALQPHVFPEEKDRRRAEQCLGSLGLNPSLPLLACSATTRQAAGGWPASFFANVLSRTVQAQPANVVLFGASHDEPTLREIAGAIPSLARVVAGELDWLAFAEVLRHCDALLAMDSGPRHLANAVGTPVVFTRNLAFSHIEAGVYCANETDLAPTSAEYLSAGAIVRLVKSVSVSDAAERLAGLLRRARPEQAPTES